MTTASQARSLVPSFLLSFTTGLGRLAAPIIRRRALAKLDQLDDRMLKDIGFTRWDINEMRRHWSPSLLPPKFFNWPGFVPGLVRSAASDTIEPRV